MGFYLLFIDTEIICYKSSITFFISYYEYRRNIHFHALGVALLFLPTAESHFENFPCLL